MNDACSGIVGLSVDWQELSRQFVVAAAHCLWQGLLIGLALAVALRLLRDRKQAHDTRLLSHAPARHAAACLALFALPVCSVATLAWAPDSGSPIVLRLPAQAGQSAAAAVGDPRPHAIAETELADRAAPSAAAPAVAPSGAATAPRVAAPTEGGDRSVAGGWDWNAWLAAVAPLAMAAYAIGASLMFLRLGRGVLVGERLKTMTRPIADAALLHVVRQQAQRIGLSRLPIVAICERVTAPVVVGIVKPLVLLPPALLCGLDARHVAAILSHEFAHIRRWDPLVHALQRVVEALFFFHPIAWWISRHVSVERENCCDDVAARACGQMDYAGALLSVAERCAAGRGPAIAGRLHALAADGAGPSQLSARIHRLLGEAPLAPFAVTRGAILWLAVAALLGGVSLVALAQSPPDPAPSSTELQPATHGDDGSTETNKAAPTAKQATDPDEPLKADEQPSGEDPADDAGERTGPRKIVEPAIRLPEHFSVLSVGFDQDSAELVTVSRPSFATIRRWDVASKKLKREVKLISDKHGQPLHENTVTLSSDRRRVVAATDDFVGVWDTETGELLSMLPVPQEKWRYGVDHLACSADGSVVAASLGYSSTAKFYDARLLIWDAGAGKLLRSVTYEKGGDLKSIALSSDGTRLATSNGGIASIWDTSTGKRLQAIRKDDCYFWTLQFSPDGRLLATSDVQGVKLFDAQSGELRRRLDAPGRYSVAKLIFSNDGQLLARTGTIWSTATGKMVYDLVTRSRDGSFSDDNSQFAIVSSEHLLRVAVWRLSGGDNGATQPDTPAAEPANEPDGEPIDQVGGYRGQKAEELIDAFKPAWSEARLGVQLGVALTGPRRPFQRGQRVPLAVFFRNVSDKPLQIDYHPNFYWDTPSVTDANGGTVEFDKIPLLGAIPHYRDTLKPGEAYGPFYFSFGLGQNPRPGERAWTPYYKSPVAGRCTLTCSLKIEVAAPDDGDPLTADAWTAAELNSSEIGFEIAEEGG